MITGIPDPRPGVAGFAVGDHSRLRPLPHHAPEPGVAVSTVVAFLAERGVDPAEFAAYLDPETASA